MPKLTNPKERGDLFARLRVKLPTALSPEERELFQRLRDATGAQRVGA
jgi:DnaJ-class molecular chaperone